MRHRSRAFGALILPAALVAASLPATSAPLSEISVTVIGLRSAKGQVLGCLTTQPRVFPDCAKDPASHKLVVPLTATTVRLEFGAVAPGRYAISLLHDENGNGKADMVLFMPKEGFGFSRDAPVRFGPPSFNSAAFAVAETSVQLTVRMRYMF